MCRLETDRNFTRMEGLKMVIGKNLKLVFRNCNKNSLVLFAGTISKSWGKLELINRFTYIMGQAIYVNR